MDSGQIGSLGGAFFGPLENLVNQLSFKGPSPSEGCGFVHW